MMVNITNVSGQNSGPNSSIQNTETAELVSPPSGPLLTYYAPRGYVGLTNGLRWFLVASVPYTVFSQGGASLSVPIFVLPPNGIVYGIRIQHSAAFIGGALSGYTLSVGTQAAPTQLASAFNVFQAPDTSVLQLSMNYQMYDAFNPTTIVAQAAAAGANLSVATQGMANIYAALGLAV